MTVFVWMMRRPLLASLVTDFSRCSLSKIPISSFPQPIFMLGWAGLTILEGRSEEDAKMFFIEFSDIRSWCW